MTCQISQHTSRRLLPVRTRFSFETCFDAYIATPGNGGSLPTLLNMIAKFGLENKSIPAWLKSRLMTIIKHNWYSDSRVRCRIAPAYMWHPLSITHAALQRGDSQR